MDESDFRAPLIRYGPYALLAAILGWMIWIRTRAVNHVISADTVYFSGNDPWYHARMVHLITEHFPATIRFDPWSNFPYGTGRHSGFGSVFDQLIALASLLLGGGDPSPHLVNVVTAYAPVIFGAATVIPVYLIARRLTDRWSALITSGLLALAGGQFLSRTVVGAADHQSAEAFFGTLAALGFLYTIRIATLEQPFIADLRDRNWIVLRRPIIASLLGGIAIASYLMSWPPGIMLVFTMGIFVIFQVTRAHLLGHSTEPIVIGTVLSMGTVGILSALFTKEITLAATAFSLLQPLVPIGIAVGSIALLILSEYLRRAGYQPRVYPIAVTASIAGIIALSAVVYPRAINLLSSLIRRVYSFGLLSSPSALTVAEIQPATLGQAWSAFGPIFYLALVGLLIMIVRVVQADRPIELFVVLWSLTMLSAYFTMVRFGYYVAVTVAILAGFAIWWAGTTVLDLQAIGPDWRDVEAYQVIGVLIILVVVVPGNVVAIENRAPVWQNADRLSGSDTAWHNELGWMRENTPEEPLSYTDYYEPPADGDFDYPPDAYGVMSWWDYGHWITVSAQRIPFANPFQQGPVPASAFLQAQSEERANLILEALPSLHEETRNIAELSNDELRSIIADQSDQAAAEDIRYVVIDDQMAGGKFGAIATWTGPGYNSYLSRQEFQVGQGTAQLVGVNQQYHQMMLARLYFADASNLEHYRLVHETQTTSTFVSVAQQTPGGGWQSANFINRRLSQQLFTAVQQRQDLAFYDVRQASRVKTYERVDGARLSGSTTAENGTPVFATLQLRTNTGRNFTYFQRTTVTESGEFTITVPYATTNGVQPTDGGTDSGVRAVGNYSVALGNPIQPTATGNAAVPEPAVYGGRTIQVTLEPVDRNQTSTRVVSPSEAVGSS